MDNLIEFAIKIFISSLTVVIFFSLYFRNFVFSRNILWQSKTFFFGLLSSLVAVGIQISLQKTFPKANSNLLKAFIFASFVEEAVRFAIIYLRIRKSSDTFTVTEGVFDGILVGLGFAFAENLHYSYRSDGFIILLRCVSSVSLHVIASGIMGYFLSYRQHVDFKLPGTGKGFNRIKARKFKLLMYAFLIPWLLHGLFDYSLFTGGKMNLLVPLFLLIGFFYLENLTVRARQVISNNVLDMLELDADDMDIIQTQKEYNKWLEESQDSQVQPHLFVNHWSLFNTVVGSSLFLMAAGMTCILFFAPNLLKIVAKVPQEVLIALLILLPLSFSFYLIFSDKVNYMFFHEHMLRLPRVSLVKIQREEGLHDIVILDVMPRGLFLTDLKDVEVGETYTIRIKGSDPRAPDVKVEGVIRWVNFVDQKQPIGAVFRYQHYGAGFSAFRRHYSYRKAINRLTNTMRAARNLG